jgi:hypothetical protein
MKRLTDRDYETPGCEIGYLDLHKDAFLLTVLRGTVPCETVQTPELSDPGSSYLIGTPN